MSLNVSLSQNTIVGYSIADKGLREEAAWVYHTNITHNLTKMARACGLYEVCWRPEEFGYKKAKDIIVPLQAGYNILKADPNYFQQYNAKNGWGVYKDFLPWVKDYLRACKEYPEADISVNR